MRSRIALGTGLLLGSVFLLALLWSAAAASVARAEGTVRDAVSGAAIPGAHIHVPALSISTTSDASGDFDFSADLPGVGALPTTIEITAANYAMWTIQDVRLVRGDTLKLDVQMGQTPTLITVPAPRSEAPDWPSVEATAEQYLFQGAAGSQLELPLPADIRVRVTGYPYCDTEREYTVETIDFKEYAKHVLPNEWGARWPGESLRAGAMAVKMYAWSYIAEGGKWPDADVYDSTCDQVYIPAISYASTDRAIDFTWNWRLTRGENLLRTYYRAFFSQCEDVGLEGNCMGQVESRDMAYDRYSWDEILYEFYSGAALSPVWNPPGGFSLRFQGNGYGDLDRVKIQIDPPVPADVGAEDFTFEWWMKALPGENASPECTPGGNSWFYGNAIFDRDIFGDGEHGDYGLSLADGRIAFGVGKGSQSHTICGATDLADAQWHHVAVVRNLDGAMKIFVDGNLEASDTGPAGDITYEDGRTTSWPNDPYLVIGAEKNDLDNALYPSFSGWLDEIRISSVDRYVDDFAPPSTRFVPDASTVALYHLNEGFGNHIGDGSGVLGGPSDGVRSYGGVINGPEWTDDTVWYVPPPTPTPTLTPTPTATSTSTPGPSPTPSITPSPSLTASVTASPTLTHTASPSPTATATITPSPTYTETPATTPSPTSTSTFTPEPTAAPTHTTEPTSTFTASPPPTQTPSPEPTATAAPATQTPTPLPTGAPAAGDLNGDGGINVLDVQLCVNVYLGFESQPSIVERADVNGDGSVNVLDVQGIANLVLGV